MMRQRAVRRMFPGGNTAQGFFSFYDNVIDTDTRRVFFLKGGPGSGKSTFMKRVADDMSARGFACEFHHCSADPESVDAVVFPEIGIALFDGTAPHVLDPKFPGVVDEMIDLGQFGDEGKLLPHKDDILRLSALGKQHFQRAYAYLAAANHVRSVEAQVNRRARDEAFVHGAMRQLVDDIASIAREQSAVAHLSPDARPGRQRRLFASSITPNGPRHHLPSLVDSLPYVFVVRGRPGAGASLLLHKVADTIAYMGLDAELFFCALDPTRLEHVIVPAIGAAVITSRPPHDYEPDEATIINLDEKLQLSADDAEHVAAARRSFDELFEHALAALADAQKCHLKVEALYAPAMDFDGMERLRLQIRDRILTYAVR